MKNKDFPSFLNASRKVPYGTGQNDYTHFVAEKNDVTGVSVFMDYHRKNLKMISTVHQMMMDSAQVMARSICVMTSDLAESQSDLMRKTPGVMNVDEDTDHQTLVLKDMIDRTAHHFYEISDIAHQSTRGTADIVRARLSDSLVDFHKALKLRCIGRRR